MNTYIGCTGWSYKDWYSGFYNRKAEKQFDDPEKLDLPHKAKWWFGKQLERVKRRDKPYFLYETIPYMAKRWNDSTPKDFIFTSKVPGMITHAKCLQECEKETRMFLRGIEPVKDKMKFLLYEFPSYFTKENFDIFKEYFSAMPKDYSYAVEFRSKDWQDREVYDFLQEKGITPVLSEVNNPGVETLRHEIETSDSLYVRIIGKHGVFTKFDRMSLSSDIKDTLEHWAKLIKDSKKLAMAFINNNFAGNAPETANLLKEMLGMEVKEWKDPGLKRFF